MRAYHTVVKRKSETLCGGEIHLGPERNQLEKAESWARYRIDNDPQIEWVAILRGDGELVCLLNAPTTNKETNPHG